MSFCVSGCLVDMDCLVVEDDDNDDVEFFLIQTSLLRVLQLLLPHQRMIRRAMKR